MKTKKMIVPGVSGKKNWEPSISKNGFSTFATLILLGFRFASVSITWFKD
jgi:hypothetical protein